MMTMPFFMRDLLVGRMRLIAWVGGPRYREQGSGGCVTSGDTYRYTCTNDHWAAARCEGRRSEGRGRIAGSQPGRDDRDDYLRLRPAGARPDDRQCLPPAHPGQHLAPPRPPPVAFSPPHRPSAA